MPASASAPHTVRAALALRHAALALLAGAPLDSRARAALADADARAWHLLLRAESCALGVAAAIRRERSGDLLTPDARAVLQAAERAELQRVLSARAQLREIDAVAAAAGVTAVVMKGGAVVGDGGALDLGDLDLAADADTCVRLAAALGARGYDADAAATGDLATVAPRTHATRTTPPHLAPLSRADGIPIELHVVDEAPPEPDPDPPATRLLRGCRTLVRELGSAPLYAVLRHAVVQHPHRRGHLRDLVVLAEAIRHGSAAELERVRAWCRADRHASELLAMLDQACAVATGAPPDDPPATRMMVARKYELIAGREAWLARAIPRWQTRLAFVLVERTALRRFELSELVHDPRRSHPAYALPALAAHAPRAADAVARTAARLYRVALAAFVVGMGPIVRWRMRTLLGAPA